MNILLLGGIGAGKSMALKILREKFQANIIEADKVAHFLYEKDREGYEVLVKLFGESILDSEKNIDRKKLGDILYYDKERLEKVNSLIHPLVNREIKNRLEKNMLNVVEQAPVPDKALHYDSIWYLHTDEEIRIKRLMDSRGLSRERIVQIISKQPTESEYRNIADRIIENNKGFDNLEKNIREALR